MDLSSLAGASIAVIGANQHASGAYPASPSYPVYRYCWLRDGSFIADAMSRAGKVASADAFFAWCAGIVEARAGRISDLIRRGSSVADDELLPTRYTLTGDDGTDPWWNFQLDGYGTWLWALATHLERHGLDRDRHSTAVALTADYLEAFGDRPCYDWWEEEVTRRHTSTLGSVAAGLSTVGRGERFRDMLSVHNGFLTKWAGSTAVDGSLLACLVPFQLVPDELAERTYQEICRQLVRDGVYRYLGDTFYGGGEWLILTAWLGWYEARTGRREAALRRLEWIAAQATPEGYLPEQVSFQVQDPSRVAEWVDRWGPVATPLLWSHAMYLTLAIELGVH